MRIKFLDLSKIHDPMMEVSQKILSYVVENNEFIGGKFIKEFEAKFAEYIGTKYCVGVGNGTDALEIAIDALDFDTNKTEIIVPSNTFIACAEAIVRSGMRPVFCDVGPDYTIDPDSCESLITTNTAAIMCVHLYGNPCNMDKILMLAKKYGLKIIEDCSQAHGAKFRSQTVGSIGDVSCFSFYPGKNLGAFGDAGAVLTSCKELATKIRLIANHGRLQKYDHIIEGRNSRLDNFQAGILLHKLTLLDHTNTIRSRVADTYFKNLSDQKCLMLPAIGEFSEPVWHLFVVRTPYRDELQAALLEAGVETSIHYPTALSSLSMYSRFNGEIRPEFAERTSAELLSLPMGSHLSVSEVIYVCKAVKDSLALLGEE